MKASQQWGCQIRNTRFKGHWVCIQLVKKFELYIYVTNARMVDLYEMPLNEVTAEKPRKEFWQIERRLSESASILKHYEGNIKIVCVYYSLTYIMTVLYSPSWLDLFKISYIYVMLSKRFLYLLLVQKYDCKTLRDFAFLHWNQTCTDIMWKFRRKNVLVVGLKISQTR